MSYWRIIHNLLRHDESPAEIERSFQACAWMSENILSLRRICTSQQIEILQHIYAFWRPNRTAPSYAILHETLLRKSVSPGICDLLSQYEEEKEDDDLVTHKVHDLGQLLTDLQEEWQSERLAIVLKVTRAINDGCWKDPITKREYIGPKDATKFLLEQVEKGMLISSRQSRGGALNDTAHEIMHQYERSKADRLAGTNRIRTGIFEIDQHLAIKRGDFVGVLGYAGQRKSTLCRSIAYNAAKAGFNVLHVSLEQSYEEERIIYGLMHSGDPKFLLHGFHLEKRRFDDGDFTQEEEKFLREVVIPDLEQNLPGRLIIRQPMDGTTWTNIKATAETVNQTTPLDLFFVDYLALVSVESRDAKTQIELNIKDAKQTALSFNEGQGVVFLTPIQGNRKGLEAAKDTGGVWDLTGIYEYSEFDRSADLILSTFVEESPGAEDCIAISSVKTRRSAPVPLFTAPIDTKIGLIRTHSQSSDSDLECRLRIEDCDL